MLALRLRPITKRKKKNAIELKDFPKTLNCLIIKKHIEIITWLKKLKTYVVTQWSYIIRIAPKFSKSISRRKMFLSPFLYLAMWKEVGEGQDRLRGANLSDPGQSMTWNPSGGCLQLSS